MSERRGCQRRNQEADEMQVILGLVAAGLGIALLSASVQHFRRPGVVYRDIRAFHFKS